jgi:alkylation response protein AidB-like acyl-CoA dehydrogenase
VAEANRPEELVGVDAKRLALQRVPGADDWARKLHEAGLMCVSWPREYGGRGLGGVEVAVLNEEFARAGVPRLTRGMGEWLVGPSIIVWGTDEQKAHFLPRISTAPIATARASPSRTRARTWRASRPAASWMATRSSSPARRCGPRGPRSQA